jgi:hypothetical protein
VAVTKPTRHLSLVMPGALGPVDLMAPAQLPSLSNYARLLARGRHELFDATAAETALFRLFGVETQGQELPVAPLSYALESGHAPQGWCMCADPVLLVPGQTSLMLMADGAQIRLSMEEATALVTDLNRHFAELGLQFEAPSPEHWYVFSDWEQVRTTPLSQVRGRSVTGRLPEGDDGVRWNGILAELQMLLHGHGLNRQRAEKGLPQVNSVWFWGGGRMPPLPKADWERVWSDETLPMALARAAGVARADRPADGREWLARAEPGRHLLLLGDLAGQLPDIPQGAWAEVMARMETAWWGPLFQAMRNGELESLYLYPLNGRRYVIDRKAARRWWRRARPWPELLEAADYGQTD